MGVEELGYSLYLILWNRQSGDSWNNTDIELQVEFDRNSSPLLDLPLVTSGSTVRVSDSKNDSMNDWGNWSDQHVITHSSDVTRRLSANLPKVRFIETLDLSTTVWRGLGERNLGWHRSGTRYIVLSMCGAWVYPWANSCCPISEKLDLYFAESKGGVKVNMRCREPHLIVWGLWSVLNYNTRPTSRLGCMCCGIINSESR